MKIKKKFFRKIKIILKKNKYKKVMKKSPLSNIINEALSLIFLHLFIIWRRNGKCTNTWLWTWLVLKSIAISFRELLSDSYYSKLIASIIGNIYGISIFIALISLFGDNCILI
jgi:hypothetical protein